MGFEFGLLLRKEHFSGAMVHCLSRTQNLTQESLKPGFAQVQNVACRRHDGERFAKIIS